ncbi:MAG: hypothetical protein U1E27_08615 [Kiritimatiellia bacterium]|nr:hypothetical protein [Kiritimatiellia bacterium]
MTLPEFQELLEKYGHRHHLIGDATFGILAALDLEGFDPVSRGT